jgi:YbbR domain-containing protein
MKKTKDKKLFDNLGLKIAAVLLSIVLWFYVTSRGQSEIPIDVPLEFANIPVGLEIANTPVKTVSLYIKGQERVIRSIKPSDARVTLNLTNAKPGENMFYITREDISLPHVVTVTSINPSSVKVITEKTASKSVKVIPVVVGHVEKDFFVKSITVEPQYILIEGTRSEIKKINNLKTEPFDITGLTDTIIQDIKLDLRGMTMRAEKSSVKLTVTIGRKKR